MPNSTNYLSYFSLHSQSNHPKLLFLSIHPAHVIYAMSLFIDSESEEGEEQHSFIESEYKRQKLDYSSGSDSDFEDVLPLSFEVGKDIDAEKRRLQLLRKIDIKKKKLAIHNLALISYILHLHLRNKLLSSRLVQKLLKKLLPSKLRSQAKKINSDVQLIYVLKYAIKWFRLNFKITCTGLRVLGYLPENKPHTDYYVQNTPQLKSKKDFISIIKQFKHNRDLGAQIFTGILRCLGFDARLVFSLPIISTKDTKVQPKLDKAKLEINRDNDLLYPYFWTEVVNPLDESELLVLEACCFYDEDKQITRVSRYEKSLSSYVPIYYPVKDQFNTMDMMYVVSVDSQGCLTDVSSRYMKNINYRWFTRLDLRTEAGRSFLLFQSILRILNTRLQKTPNPKEIACLRYLGLLNYDIPTTRAAIKRNPNFTTPSTIRYDEVIDGTAKPIAHIKMDGKKVPIYLRTSIIVGKSIQQWKFLGRSVLPNESHIKTTKSLRPRTIARQRVYNLNILNNQPELNEVKLYSFNQTCPYIKEKVEYLNGKPLLPKNKFGNIEIYRENMVPDGCVWLKLSNIENAIKSIDYVPVVSGFKFTKYGHARPLKSGVIVLEKDAIDAKKLWFDYKIRERQERQKKRNILVLYGWYQLIKRLKIRDRLNKEYDQV